MSMERSAAGFRTLGDHDLVDRQAEIQQEFANRHPGLTDIPLTGRLPGETSRLDPSLEGKIRTVELTIGGKTAQELLAELASNKIKVGSYARSMVENPEFTTLPEPTTMEVGLVRVGDLGIKKDYPTTADIIGTKDDVDEQGNSIPFTKGKISELGLELLPPEALLHQLLENVDKLQRCEVIIAGMKPIADFGGHPSVFCVVRSDDGWLSSYWAEPSDRWRPDGQFAFSRRK
jgi:hypothetical protein